jgi:hypothetical protein
VIASWGYGDRTEHETDHAKGARYLKSGAAKPHLSEAQTAQRRSLRRTQKREQPSWGIPVTVTGREPPGQRSRPRAVPEAAPTTSGRRAVPMVEPASDKRWPGVDRVLERGRASRELDEILGMPRYPDVARVYHLASAS